MGVQAFLPPYGARDTLRYQVSDSIWVFEQLQSFVNVTVTIRMTAVKLRCSPIPSISHAEGQGNTQRNVWGRQRRRPLRTRASRPDDGVPQVGQSCGLTPVERPSSGVGAMGRLLKEIGDVKYVVLPVTAVEHKVSHVLKEVSPGVY
jgi:hypothetical protein